MVRLPEPLVARYPRFTLYNSPYAAHDRGCAVDLYPDAGSEVPSPVAGEVVETHTVRAPPKPYAPEHDHLVVVDVDDAATGLEPTDGEAGDYLARVLHVEPAVESGDEVAVGDGLGSLVRAGFFAPWVAPHLHVGFRPRDADPVRASGSLPVRLGFDVEPVAWDGTGSVVEVADTYVVLDAPDHPAPGRWFVGVAADEGVVLDGGLPHYDGGGALGGSRQSHPPVGAAAGGDASPARTDGSLSLLGTRVGRADGRDVAWDGVEVHANGRPVTGLSLFCGREELYAKLVCPDREFAVGDDVTVTLERPDG
jgi:hypothetical protein